MKNRRQILKVVALALFVLTLLGGTYKLAEHRTEKESYREGYTYGYVEGHSNGVERGAELLGEDIQCTNRYNYSQYYDGKHRKTVYADVICSEDDFFGPTVARWVWPSPQYVGPGPRGVPATSGPNAK